MSDFVTDTGVAVNAPQRPGAQEVIGQQPDLFPFDAFNFSDITRLEDGANPKLKMKSPWELISSGLEVYEDGVDEDNLIDGDRRLIVEGEVLKLQHYDPDGDGQVDGWVDDISLGGYDKNSEFVDYIQAAGISQDREDALLQPKGLGLPAPLRATSYSEIMNSLEGTVQRGNWAGTPYYESYIVSGESEWESEVQWADGNWYTYGCGIPTEIHDVVDFDLAAFDLAGVGLSLWRTVGTMFLYDDAAATGTGDDIWMYLFAEMEFFVEPITHEIRIDVEYTLTNTRDSVSVIKSSSVSTRIFLEDGINRFNMQWVTAMIPNVNQTTGASILTEQYGFNSSLVIKQKTTSGEYTKSEEFVGDLVQNTTTVTGVPLVGKGGTLWSGNSSQGGLAATHITAGFTSETAAIDVALDFQYGWYMQIPLFTFYNSTYVSEVFNLREDFFRQVDRFRDVALIPSSQHGKVILFEGGYLPGEFEDKWVSVVGSQGSTGDTGAKGETGEDGEDGIGISFTDGGTFSSIYLPDQVIDGGGF